MRLKVLYVSIINKVKIKINDIEGFNALNKKKQIIIHKIIESITSFYIKALYYKNKEIDEKD